MNEWLGMGAVFGSVFIGCFALLEFVVWRRQRELDRLKAATADLDSSPEMILGDMTESLAGQIPIEGEKRDALNQELLQAGFYGSTAMLDYAAIRVVLIVLPLIIAGALAIVVQEDYVPYTLVGGLFFAALGFSLPRVYVNWVAGKRRREIERGLPVAVDLLALGLMSGQNIVQALARVTREIRTAFPILAQELELVRRQAELNTLPHALSLFAERVQIDEVRNLVIILSQSQRQGSDAAAALMEFVNNFRASIRQKADTRANQASFWLVFPSIFFLWVPAFAILLAPIIFEMSVKKEETAKQTRETQQQIRDLKDANTAPSPPPGSQDQ